MKYEEAYEDMLDYLGVCGNFNLTSDYEWSQLKTLASLEKVDIDF
jgi:hypothetical protein